MKERPILFSGAMVRAILANTKTQTRRIAKRVGVVVDGVAWTGVGKGTRRPDERGARMDCPYGKPNDRLWVRETWAGDDLCGYVYRADHPDADLSRGDLDDGEQSIRSWAPSIHMPRAVSRIDLEVTAVRVERLQDITEEDARAEGMEIGKLAPATINGAPGEVAIFDPRMAFAVGWDGINGKRGAWASDPWVWVVSFRRAP